MSTGSIGRQRSRVGAALSLVVAGALAAALDANAAGHPDGVSVVQVAAGKGRRPEPIKEPFNRAARDKPPEKPPEKPGGGNRGDPPPAPANQPPGPVFKPPSI